MKDNKVIIVIFKCAAIDMGKQNMDFTMVKGKVLFQTTIAKRKIDKSKNKEINVGKSGISVAKNDT